MKQYKQNYPQDKAKLRKSKILHINFNFKGLSTGLIKYNALNE